MVVPGHSLDKLQITILQWGFKSQCDHQAREAYITYEFNTVDAGINESSGRLSCGNV